MKWKLVKAALAILAVALAVIVARHVLEVLNVASAYYAKTLCSGVFVSGRPAEDVVASDVLADMALGYNRFGATVDRKRALVTGSLFGLARRTAVYRPGLGCTLVNGASIEALRAQLRGVIFPQPASPSAAPWPKGEIVNTGDIPPGVNRDKLRATLDAAFAEPREDALRRTRAVVVVHKGRIVAERYAPGFTADTPLIGWSMGKSIAGALIGILMQEGALDAAAKGLFPEWRAPGDPRSAITLDHLMRMTSGLDFDDPHERMLSDVRKMLFLLGDAAAYARAKSLAAEPGTWWQYGSGATLLMSALLRAASGSPSAYFTLPRRALFGPLGMRSAVVEPDASGTLLLPAFVYASARDWARFGLLMLNDGVWQGRRILPEGWVQYSLSPTPASDGLYGAQFWRRVPPFLRPPRAPERPLPADRFYMLGHDGQMVAVIPSRDLVIVRLGLSRRRGAWDPDALVFDVLKAVPAPTS